MINTVAVFRVALAGYNALAIFPSTFGLAFITETVRADMYRHSTLQALLAAVVSHLWLEAGHAWCLGLLTLRYHYFSFCGQLQVPLAIKRGLDTYLVKHCYDVGLL